MKNMSCNIHADCETKLFNRRRCAFLSGFAVLLAVAASGGMVFAGSVDLHDPSFGTGGIATAAFGSSDDVGNSVAVQSDGKIVVGGYTGTQSSRAENAALIRLTADGVLDTSFNGSGKRSDNLALYGVDDAIWGIGLQADGKIVTGGYTFYNVFGGELAFGFARYTTAGVLDSTYGSGGHTEMWINASGSSFNDANLSICKTRKRLAIQPDGKAVVAGMCRNENWGRYEFAVARCNTNGSADTTFNGNGRVRTQVGYRDGADAGRDIAWDVVVQADGKIVVVGEAYSGGSSYSNRFTNFAVVRYNSDGSLDSSFNGGGIVLTPISPDNKNDVATAVKIQGDGKIVVGGYTYNTAKGATNFALVRYLSDGSLDTSFGTNGKVTTALGAVNDKILSLVLDGNFIVVAGVTNNGVDNDFAIARYTSDGALDPSFGNSGTYSFGIGSGEDQANDIAVDANGRYVLAGYTSNGSNYDFAVARIAAVSKPAIIAEQPSGTGLTGGASTVDFGTLVANGGSSGAKVFVIRNAGAADLTGIAITKNGTNSNDFVIDTTGTSATLTPGGNTTFSVTFSPSSDPGSAAARSAALHIASNDDSKNPFDIALTGTGLSLTHDTDDDSLSDGAEYLLSALGFDWQTNQAALVSALYTNANAANLFSQAQVDASRQAGRSDITGSPNTYNLFTLDQIQALNVGKPLLTKDAGGQFKLTIGVQKSTDLQTFSAFPVTEPQAAINAEGKIEIQFTAPANEKAAFFRLQAR